MPKQLYEVFVSLTSTPKHHLPWEELPPITQAGWEAVWARAQELTREA